MEPTETSELQDALDKTNEYTQILRKLERSEALCVVTVEVGEELDKDVYAETPGMNFIYDPEFIGNMKTWLQLKIGALSRIINERRPILDISNVTPFPTFSDEPVRQPAITSDLFRAINNRDLRTGALTADQDDEAKGIGDS